MDIRFSLIDKVDGKSLAPIVNLIHSFLDTHPNVGCIEICRNEIRFTKGVFFTIGRISYSPYNISCRNGIIFYDGTETPNIPKDDLSTILYNAIIRLRQGYVVKI